MRRWLITILVIFFFAIPASANWSFEVYGGSALNFLTPLGIFQTGYEPIILNAHYATNPFKEAPYYGLRISRFPWELELIHHKLYLLTPHPEIQHFEISHGYNLIFMNHICQHYGFTFRLGQGLVLTHPETTIRGKTLPWNNQPLNGFYISGLAWQGAISKEFPLSSKLYFVVETKLTIVPHALVPIADGIASARNVAIHIIFGYKYYF